MKPISLITLVLLPLVGYAQTYEITSEKRDVSNIIVTVPGKNGFWQIPGTMGNHYGQSVGQNVVIVIPRLKASVPQTVTFPQAQILLEPVCFDIAEMDGHVDITYGKKNVLRFMNAKRDSTTKDTHELTFKPFHHVFDPEKGETLLTNGAGLASNKALLYPHHRGLFYAFNKVSYGKETCDVWHGRNGEYVEFDRTIAKEVGPVFAKHRAALSWHGKDGKVFANEEREITTYHVTGGTMIDFHSTLKTELEKVRLDGDPQHAGFHFRAAMEVAKNGKANTYYVRPDGKGKIGETRNWDPKTKDPRTINLPWDACSFVIDGKRYTCLRMVHPGNPLETRGSERDYGRFGDYFEWDLTPRTPLIVNYRIWIQKGEMTVDQCAAMYSGYTVPPKIVTK